MALLITSEIVTIPSNALGFISIKAGIKFRGLVNISGFHVDPGFRGRLKFTVYNAGSRPVFLAPGDPAFLIWFCSLDGETEKLYNGNHMNQMEISSKDIAELSGDIASPAALKSKLDKLELESTKRYEAFENALEDRRRDFEFNQHKLMIELEKALEDKHRELKFEQEKKIASLDTHWKTLMGVLVALAITAFLAALNFTSQTYTNLKIIETNMKLLEKNSASKSDLESHKESTPSPGSASPAPPIHPVPASSKTEGDDAGTH